jgi:Cd2+/Zn2+-exporting ATPase
MIASEIFCGGLQSMLLESSESSEVCSHCAGHEDEDKDSNYRLKGALMGISGVSLFLAIVFEFILPNPLLVYIFSLTSMGTAGRWIIPRGFRGAAKLHLDINFLMTFAGVGALLIGAPTEGAAAIFLFFVANVLEDKAGDRVKEDIRALIELSPQEVTVKQNGEMIVVPVEEVKLGDVVAIKPGESIGLDGTVVSGISMVNQATITGESTPVSKEAGSEVYAGTMNLDGYLEFEVTHEVSDTVFSRIVRLVDEARSKKSKTERAIARFSHVYTPLVVLGAILVVVISVLVQMPIEAAVYRGLTLLVISCPCAFALSIPIAMVSSITGSARHGILVKGAEHMESLSNASVVAFDKTGTLTLGSLEIIEVCGHDGYDEEGVLKLAASLESLSEHPISKALIKNASDRGMHLHQVEDFVALPGKGVTGKVDGTEVVVGRKSLLIEHRVTTHDMCPSKGGTLVYVAAQGIHIGTIVLGDTVRPGTDEVINDLKSLGLRTVMLTGDNEKAAEAVAATLGLDEYKANLLPHEKVDAIEELSSTGTAVMVGEGINDAPALAAADVSIAMGVIGSDLALETADVALMEDDLGHIPSLIKQSRKTMGIVRQNVALSIGLKAIVAALAFVGLATLWLAVGLGDMGVSLLVIVNAMRLAFRLN